MNNRIIKIRDKFYHILDGLDLICYELKESVKEKGAYIFMVFYTQYIIRERQEGICDDDERTVEVINGYRIERMGKVREENLTVCDFVADDLVAETIVKHYYSELIDKLSAEYKK